MRAKTLTTSSTQGQDAGIRRRRCRAERGQAGGHVQQPVTQRLRFCGRQCGLVESDQAQPGNQIGSDLDGPEPGGVDRELPRREPAQAGVFCVPDPILDRGVGTVSGIEERQLAALGVGDEGLVAAAVGFLEQRQLGARVGSFAAVGQEVPPRRGDLGGRVGTIHAVPGVPTRTASGHLHHQLDRVAELPVTQDHQEPRPLPQRRRSREAAVAGDLQHRGQAGT